MIHDVDESLRALVKRDALNGTRVDIAFDAPTKDWSARQNAPSVNLYLYDIREDLQRREVGWERRRDESGRVTDHRLPPRRYRLSYLVTAWTQRPEDEHRLLSALLSAFLRYPVIPAEVAAGTLADSELPVYMTVALPPSDDRSIADVWSALGGELKPSLDLVVTAPMDVERHIDAAPPVIEHGLRVVSGDGTVESAGGRPAAARRAFHRPLMPSDSAAQEETVLGDIEGEEGTGVKRPAAGKGAGKAADRDARPGRRIRVRGIPRP